MAIQTQFRRGNSYSHSLFTGASGEITVDLDKKVAVVHDGATVGGFPLSLNAYTAAAYNQANTASTIAGLAFNAANSASSSSVTSVGGASGVISNVQLAASITSSGLLTTANISELTNLYFTNARSRATISIASGNVNGKGSYDSATGVISINAANVTVSSSAPTDPYIGDVWIHADTAVEYLYFSDGTSFQWAEVSAAGTGGGSSSNYGDSNVALLGYATNANVSLKANITDLTTANVVENTNLYFTNARVYSNVTQLGYITSTSLSGYATNTQLGTYATNAQLTSYATTTNVALKANVVDLTTANVIENTNLYFTNVRVYSNVTQLGYITSASLSGYATNAQLGAYATNTQLGSYATNAQLASYATTTNVALKANVVDLTTANVTEVTNQYFTNARAIAAVTNTSLSNITVSGNVAATNFVGSGSSLTGVALKTTGSWTVTTGTNTYSFTVPASGTYQLWVDCNIPNGILAWNATATITNSNVPIVGAQYAWVYNGGGSPVDFTSIPNQFTGTSNTIVRSSVGASGTTNRFDFGINNSSGGNITVRYGWVAIS